MTACLLVFSPLARLNAGSVPSANHWYVWPSHSWIQCCILCCDNTVIMLCISLGYQETQLDVVMSRYRYPQSWLKTFQFCCQEHGWKMCRCLLRNLWFCCWSLLIRPLSCEHSNTVSDGVSAGGDSTPTNKYHTGWPSAAHLNTKQMKPGEAELLRGHSGSLSSDTLNTYSHVTVSGETALNTTRKRRILKLRSLGTT